MINLLIHNILVYLTVICLNLNCGQSSSIANSKSSLIQRSIAPDGLTILSFAYNPSRHIPEWVEPIFGEKSVDFNAISSPKVIFSHTPLSATELQHSNKLIRETLNDFSEIPALLYPKCSIELFGTVILDKFNSFRRRYQRGVIINRSIPMGRADLLIDSMRDISWKCYYRALHENWKPESDFTLPNYWSVIFYCPQLLKEGCDTFRHLPGNHANLTVTIQLRQDNNQTLSNRFIADLARVKSNRPKKLLRTALTKSTTTRSPMRFPVGTIGVCLAIPYTTTDVKKRIGNNVMLTEWLKYYSALAMPIFVYDNGGRNGALIEKVIADYQLQHVYHYNYTVRGLLVKESAALEYDNNEMTNTLRGDGQPSNKLSLGQRFKSQGVDKTLTLSHCRFEANAVFGIDHILVVDFDEFLYCPRGEFVYDSPEETLLELDRDRHPKVSAHVQSKYIQYITTNARQGGHRQMVASQRVLANKTASNRNCVISQALQNQSIFDCISSHGYFIDRHSIKAIHLGHHCPLTGFHQSCATGLQPRAYDCLCDTVELDEWVCTIMHFTTNEQQGNKRRVLFENGDELIDDKQMVNMRKSVNEIKQILEQHYS